MPEASLPSGAGSSRETSFHCSSMSGCPGVHKLASGDYLGVGAMPDASSVTAAEYTQYVAPGEAAVVIPAEALRKAVLDHMGACGATVEFTFNDQTRTLSCTEASGHQGWHGGPGGGWAAREDGQ